MCVVINRGRPSPGQGNGVSLTRSEREITERCETIWGLTHWMGGGWEELNGGRGSVVDSNLLCSEYDSRAVQAANETNSWERDHSCNTGNVTPDGKYLGEVEFLYWWDPRKTHCRVLWTKVTQNGNAAKLLSMGWCLKTLLWYDLVDFWWARESKCSMVLSILESLKAWRRLQWGLFFIGSLLCPKKDKSIHRSSPILEGMRDIFTIGSPIRQEKVKPILVGWSFKYFHKHERNQVCSAIFSWWDGWKIA